MGCGGSTEQTSMKDIPRKPTPPTPPPPPPKEPEQPPPKEPEKPDSHDAVDTVTDNLVNKNDLLEEPEDLLQLSHNVKDVGPLIKNSEYSLKGSWLLIEAHEAMQKFSANMLEAMTEAGLEPSSIVYLLIADNQSELLTQTIDVAVLFYEKPKVLTALMQRTGARFRGYGATPSFFQVWRETFFSEFPKHVGDLVFGAVCEEWHKLWDLMTFNLCEGNTGKESEFFASLFRERNAKRLSVDMEIIMTREANCQPCHRFAPSMLERADELFTGLTDEPAVDVVTMMFVFDTYTSMVPLLLTEQRLKQFLQEKKDERLLSRTYLVALHQPFLDTCKQFLSDMWNPAVACRISTYYHQMVNVIGGVATIPLMVERGTAIAVETYQQQDRSASMWVTHSDRRSGSPCGCCQRSEEGASSMVGTHQRKSKHVFAEILQGRDKSIEAAAAPKESWTLPKDSVFARSERAAWTNIQLPRRDQGNSSVVASHEATAILYDGSTAARYDSFGQPNLSTGPERCTGQDQTTCSLVRTHDQGVSAIPSTQDSSTGPKHCSIGRLNRSTDTDPFKGHDQGTSSVVGTQDQGTSAGPETKDHGTAPEHPTFQREERASVTEHQPNHDQGTSSVVGTQEQGTSAGPETKDYETVSEHPAAIVNAQEPDISTVGSVPEQAIAPVEEIEEEATPEDAHSLCVEAASSTASSGRGRVIALAANQQTGAALRPPARLPKLVSSNSSMAATGGTPRRDPTVFQAVNPLARKKSNRGCLLCTNLENSSALWQRDPEMMYKVQKSHHRIIRRVIARFGGQEVKTVGDSFIIAASKLVDGLQIALGIQLEFMREVPIASGFWMTTPTEGAGNPQCWNERAIRVRVALEHCKEESYDVTKRRYDYCGPSMTRCAHIESVACGGQILMSKDTFVALKDDLELSQEPCDPFLQAVDPREPTSGALKDFVSFVDIGVVNMRGRKQSTHLISTTPKCLDGRKFNNEVKRVTLYH